MCAIELTNVAFCHNMSEAFGEGDSQDSATNQPAVARTFQDAFKELAREKTR